MLFFYTVPLSTSHVMYAGCISSLPYRPPSCNLHIQTSSHVCSVPAPVSASFIRSLYPPSLYVFLLSSKLPDYQLRNSLIVSHLNSFYRRLPSVTVFLTEHAPNPRAAVISVYDTNPVNAFSVFFPCTSISMIPPVICPSFLTSFVVKHTVRMIIHHAINFKSNTMALASSSGTASASFANTCLMKAACFLSTLA